MQPDRSPNAAAFDGKVRSLREAMREQKLSALLFYSTGQLSMLEVNPVLWISGLLPMGPHTGVLVTDAGDATMLIGLAWDEGRARERTWIEDVRVTDRFAETVKELAVEKRIGGDIGLVGWAFMPAAIYQALGKQFGGRLKVADSILSSLARFPGAESLPALTRAAEIADRGFEAIMVNAKVGMAEYELAAELYCETKRLGAEDNFLLLSASQHNLAVRAAGGRVLDVGDIILSEITPCYQGQFAQICRTTVIGKPTAVMQEKYAILQAAMRAGQKAAVPGASVRDVTAAMDGCFSASGYGDYCRPPYMRVRGHGLGITSDLPGDLTAESDTRLEQGMVFVMHPNQYIPETGYLMCGEPVVITPDGAKALSAKAAELDCVVS